MDWNIAIGVGGVLFAGISAYYTWKQSQQSKSDKETVEEAIRLDRRIAEYDELHSKLVYCMNFIVPRAPPIMDNIVYDEIKVEAAIQSEVNYVCERLLDIWAGDSKKISKINSIENKMTILRYTMSAPQDKLSSYGLVITALDALLKSV